MKEKKKVHAGLCVTDERIVGVTAHIENKTMVITDALEMKRTGSIDEDVANFIETYDLDDGEYSIVADIKTQMHMAAYDPHDFDVKEFIKWNVDDYFDFDGDCFQWMHVVENIHDIIITCSWWLLIGMIWSY